MIRFSASLVIIAVGLLIAGVVTSKLTLVYIAIGVSGVALLALGIGAAVHWRELTGKPTTAVAEASAPEPAAAEQAAVSSAAASSSAVPSVAEPSVAEPSVAEPQAPVPAARAVGAEAVGVGPSRPAAQVATGSGWPAEAQPAAPPTPLAFTPRPKPPARDVWEPRAAPAQPASAQPASPQPAASGQPSGKDQPADRQDKAGAIEPEQVSDTGTTSVATASASPQAEQDQSADKAEPEHPANPESPGLDPSREVTVVPGVPRYHNARCILIRFMGESDLDKMTLAAAREEGCTPCRACLPDQPEKSPELLPPVAPQETAPDVLAVHP